MAELLGGQAVIDGVMMKGKNRIAIAVRKKKKIVVKKGPFVPLTKRNKVLGLVFVRGVVNLFEMLAVGIRALEWSANQALEAESGEKEEMPWWQLGLSLVTALALALLLFKLVPLGITKYLLHIENRFLFNIVDGLIRIALFTGYLFLISLWKDVRVLFQYHGAEHKAVSCYEAKLPLTVRNVQKFSTRHPRCGTSFIIFVFLIAILIFSLVSIKMNFFALFFIRLLLVLPIAGISYEVLRSSALMRNKMFFRLIIAPGMLFQGITTKEPTDKQVEVSIKALKNII